LASAPVGFKKIISGTTLVVVIAWQVADLQGAATAVSLPAASQYVSQLGK